MKCVANVERELGLGLRWFRSDHAKCTGWKNELEKRQDGEKYSPSVHGENFPLQSRISGGHDVCAIPLECGKLSGWSRVLSDPLDTAG